LTENVSFDPKSEDKGHVKIDFADEGDRLELPPVPSYEWMPHEPRMYITRFRWGNDLVALVGKADFFKEEVEKRSLWLKICADNERVCHGGEGAKLDFLYVYACSFQDMFLTLPFVDWQMVVLREIYCAPT